MPLLRATATTIQQLDEPALLRRVSLNLPTMALLAGAGLRLYRAVVLQFGWSDSWLWIAGTFIGGAVFLFLMVTLHLGNYALRSWWWRAPLFALAEAATEILVSLALTLFGLEVVGSITATLEDWQSTSTRILFFRATGITIFAVSLALVSTLVRLMLMRAREESK